MSLVYYFFGTQCISISRVSVLTRDKKSMNHIATVLIAYRLWSISTTQYADKRKFVPHLRTCRRLSEQFLSSK